jgi:hypothetical protein
MAYLFTINNLAVIPVPETYQIYPFKDILDRDNSVKKVVALQEFAYIEFMSSMKKSNPFAGYDNNVKEKKIIERVFNGENYSPDELVLKGIEFIDKLQKQNSPTYSLYLSAREGVEKVKKFLNTVDVDERDERNKPMFKASDVLKTINEVPKVLATLKELEQKIQAEDLSLSKNRGELTVGIFADPSRISRIKRK